MYFPGTLLHNLKNIEISEKADDFKPMKQDSHFSSFHAEETY